jgi:hypothetical protein
MVKSLALVENKPDKINIAESSLQGNNNVHNFSSKLFTLHFTKKGTYDVINFLINLSKNSTPPRHAVLYNCSLMLSHG